MESTERSGEGDARASLAITNQQVLAAAAAIANARGGRAGVPEIENVLDILPPNLLAEVTEDAEAALKAGSRCVAGQKRVKLCHDALAHVLGRIQEDEKVRYILGVGTSSFEKLTLAYAEMIGEDVDLVRDRIIPGSAAIHKER